MMNRAAQLLLQWAVAAEVLVEKRWGQTHKLAFHLLDSFGGRIRSISRRGMAAIFG